MRIGIQSLIIVLVAVVAASAGSVSTWQYFWDASELPEVFQDGNVFLPGSSGTGTSQTLVDIGGGNKVWQCVQADKADARWIDTLPGLWSPTSNSSFEFRLKIVSQPDPTSEVFEVWCADAQLQPGDWECRAFYFSSTYIVEGSSPARENQNNKVMFDTSSNFVTYRVEYANGTANLFYRNGTVWSLLLTSSVGRVWTDFMNPSMLEFGDAQPWTGAGTWQLDYIGFGKECSRAISGDFNGDCKVDFKDFSELAQNWMRCVKPDFQNCDEPWQN